MIIPAAQPFSARYQSSAEIGWASRNGGGIINGILVEEGGELLIEKRPGYAVSATTDVPTLDTGDYVLNAGIAAVGTTSIFIVYDASDTGTELHAYNGIGDLGSIGGGGTPGSRMYIDGLDSYGIIINDDDNVGYTVLANVMSQITDAQFPASLSYGAAVLNGRVYVGDKANGRIYNCEEGNPTSYLSTDYIACARSPDTLKAVFKHKDHVVGFGANSIELFYDNGNPSGSPLRRRDDVFYQVGLAATSSLSSMGDSVYFVGYMATKDNVYSAKKSVYVLENFAVRKISTDAIDALINDVNFVSEGGLAGVCYTTAYGGRAVYVLTLKIDQTTAGDTCTLVYDVEKDFWYEWTWQGGANFPLVGVINSDSTRGALLRDGTMINGGGGSLTHRDGGTDFTFGFRTAASEFGSPNRKFFGAVSVLGDYCTTGNWSIRYSDDDYATWSTARTMSTTSRGILPSWGSAYKRAWEVTITASTPARLRGLSVPITEGRS